MRPSGTSPRRKSGPTCSPASGTGAAGGMTHRMSSTCSFSPKTTCRSIPSFPGYDPRHRRALDPRAVHQSVQLAHVLRRKFSTSQRRGVCMDQALEHFPADVWRYYLIAQAPESDDATSLGNISRDGEQRLANTSATSSTARWSLRRSTGHRIPAGARRARPSGSCRTSAAEFSPLTARTSGHWSFARPRPRCASFGP